MDKLFDEYNELKNMISTIKTTAMLLDYRVTYHSCNITATGSLNRYRIILIKRETTNVLTIETRADGKTFLVIMNENKTHEEKINHLKEILGEL